MSSCSKNNNNSEILSFSADSARIDRLYQGYVESVNTNYDESRIVLKQLFDTINSLPPERQKLSIQFFAFISVSEAFNGNLDRADSLTLLSLDRANEIGDIDYFDVAHQNRGIYYWLSGQQDSAKHHLLLAADYAEQTHDIDQILAAKSNLASFFISEGGYQKSINTLTEALVLLEKYEKWQYYSDVCNNLAGIYFDMNQLYTALKYYHKSIDLQQKHELKLNCLTPKNNIGIIYSRLGMDSLAINTYSEVLKLSEEMNNTELYAATTINQAHIKYKRREYNQAYNDLIGVLNYLEDNKIPLAHNYVYCYNTLGEVEISRNNLAQAKEWLLKARELSTELDLLMQYEEATRLLTEIYIKEGKIKLAKQYASAGLDTAFKYDFVKPIRDFSLQLAHINNKIGNSQECIRFYKIFEKNSQRFLDSLTINKTKDFAYYSEIQRKDSETKLLQKDKEFAELQNLKNQEIIRQQRITIILGIFLVIVLIITITIISGQLRFRSRTNKILQEENAFKNNLFSIVSHDLRSPITSLYQMLQLIKLNRLSKEKRLIVEKDLLSKTEKTIDLIDNLLLWTREQLKGNNNKTEEIQVRNMLSEIIEGELENTKLENINFSNLIPDTFVIQSNRNIVHLVFRNLLSNAYKYTPDGGKIEVRAKMEKQFITFSVSDSGIGISAEDHNKILDDSEVISFQGLHGEKGKGLGLVLCKYFLRKIDGEIWFESIEGKGTTFHFSIPQIKAL